MDLPCIWGQKTSSYVFGVRLEARHGVESRCVWSSLDSPDVDHSLGSVVSSMSLVPFSPKTEAK